jgi:hypothetical protein
LKKTVSAIAVILFAVGLAYIIISKCGKFSTEKMAK